MPTRSSRCESRGLRNSLPGRQANAGSSGLGLAPGPQTAQGPLEEVGDDFLMFWLRHPTQWPGLLVWSRWGGEMDDQLEALEQATRTGRTSAEESVVAKLVRRLGRKLSRAEPAVLARREWRLFHGLAKSLCNYEAGMLQQVGVVDDEVAPGGGALNRAGRLR